MTPAERFKTPNGAQETGPEKIGRYALGYKRLNTIPKKRICCLKVRLPLK